MFQIISSLLEFLHLVLQASFDAHTDSSHAHVPYWNTGSLEIPSWHPNPEPSTHIVPRCNLSPLFWPLDHSPRSFLGSLTFSCRVGSRSGLDVWYRSLAFKGCVHSISSVFWGYHFLLVVVWSVLRVSCCWWSQASWSEGFFYGRHAWMSKSSSVS